MRKSYIRTKETREKNRLAMLGHAVSEEMRRKISQSLFGRKLSQIHIEKIKSALKGKRRKPLTEEHKEKLSIAHKGKFPWNKGLKGIMKKNSGSFKRGYDVTKHWNWKGGITPLMRKIRSSIEISEWRKKVFERDNYTCQKCGEKEIVSGKLHAHHPFQVKDLVKYCLFHHIFNPDNGITLCKTCHLNLHGLLKKAVNSGELLTGNAEDNPEPSQAGIM